MIDKEIIKKNIIIRYKILENLYLANFENKGHSFNDLIQSMGHSESEINLNMKFLKQEDIIDAKWMADGRPKMIRITNKGINLVEKIELLRKNKEGTSIYDTAFNWIKDNASWIITVIIDILKSGA